MAPRCHDQCSKYKPIRKYHRNSMDYSYKQATGKYFEFIRWCTVCQRYLQWKGLRCPCCNIMLRLKPTASYRQRFNSLLQRTDRPLLIAPGADRASGKV